MCFYGIMWIHSHQTKLYHNPQRSSTTRPVQLHLGQHNVRTMNTKTMNYMGWLMNASLFSLQTSSLDTGCFHQHFTPLKLTQQHRLCILQICSIVFPTKKQATSIKAGTKWKFQLPVIELY